MFELFFILFCFVSGRRIVPDILLPTSSVLNTRHHDSMIGAGGWGWDGGNKQQHYTAYSSSTDRRADGSYVVTIYT